MWACLAYFHLWNLSAPLIHSDLSIVRDRWAGSGVTLIEWSPPELSLCFPHYSPGCLPSFSFQCFVRAEAPGHVHTHTHTSPGAQKRGRDRGLSLLLWSKHSSILSAPLSFPSITPCLLNHSPPISVGFIHGYYLVPRLSMKHTQTHTQISICTYIVHFSPFFPQDQLDGSKNVKRLYETRVALDTHAIRHCQVRHTHVHAFAIQ